MLRGVNLLDVASTALYNNVQYPACKALIETGVWFAALEECSLGMEAVLADAEVRVTPFPLQLPELCDFVLSSLGLIYDV